jgi:hypothetical protein
MPERDDPPRPRKDRLIQTRVPRELESTLKAEARRRRLTVSGLIRSVLEDAFDLVDGVVADAEEIVHDSARLARNVSRNARRLASPGRERAARAGGRGGAGGLGDTEAEFPHVYAWNELVLNRPAACSGCGAELARGECGFLGLSDDPDAERPCLCSRCVEALRPGPA